MKNRGTKYKEALKKVNKQEELPINEAVDLVKDLAYADFEEALELKVNLNIDPGDSDQKVRFISELPYPTGRTKKIYAVTDEDINEEFETLEIITGTEKLEDIKNGNFVPGKDFDVVVAEPKNMSKIADVAKILGPRGMMPSPKTGTIGEVKKVLKRLDKGQVEVRSEPKNKVIHLVLGTENSKTEEVVENFNYLITEINRNKPKKVGKDFITSAYVSTTMSPSVRVQIN